MLPLTVAKTFLPLGVVVSTIDVMDFGYCETMIFGGKYDQECQRTTSREAATLLHQRVVERLGRGLAPWDSGDPDEAVQALDAGVPERLRGLPDIVPPGCSRVSYLAGFEAALTRMSDSPGSRVLLWDLLEAAKARRA